MKQEATKPLIKTILLLILLIINIVAAVVSLLTAYRMEKDYKELQETLSDSNQTDKEFELNKHKEK